MEIAILGPGCAKCKAVERVVRQAVEELEVEVTILKVEEIKEIMKYRVMMTPAMAVDGEVKISGRVPGLEEVIALISV